VKWTALCALHQTGSHQPRGLDCSQSPRSDETEWGSGVTPAPTTPSRTTSTSRLSSRSSFSPSHPACLFANTSLRAPLDHLCTLFGMPSDMTPSALTEAISTLLQRHFNEPVWVRATLASFRVNKGGYANWVLTDDEASPVKLDVTASPATMQRIHRKLASDALELQEHLPLRVALTPVISRFGKLACELSDIDTAYSKQRHGLTPQQVFEQLQQAGLANKQQRLTLEEFPFNLVVVGSNGSDGVRDTLAVLESSNIAFRIGLIDVPVQGLRAPGALLEALSIAASLPTTPDAILLVRGGGDRADLVAFDDPALAAAICQITIPVLCGIGHEADTTVCDLVAHHSERTPTGIASWLHQRVAAGFLHRDKRFDATVSHLLERLDAASLALARRDSAIDAALTTLDTSAAALDVRLERAIALAESGLQNTASNIDKRLDRSLSLAESALAATSSSLSVHEATLRELHPRRALERGFAIVRTGNDVVRSSAIPLPAKLHIELADGTLDATAHS
jgi:exodeoxyribonuclease VII large subunit